MVRVCEHGQDYPFGDLGAVDSGAGRKGNRGVGVNGRVGYVISAGGEEMD